MLFSTNHCRQVWYLNEWKLANIVSVHKKGDREHAENYRPISLLPLVSKVFERCIFNSIKYHVFRQINPCQHGFVAGRSCVTQLIEVLEHIGRVLDRRKQIDVIYLDMSKVFDKVSYTRLLSRVRFWFRWKHSEMVFSVLGRSLRTDNRIWCNIPATLGFFRCA